MGTCFSQLKSVKKKHKRLLRLEHSYYRKNEDKVELHFLVEEEELQVEESNHKEISTTKRICRRIHSYLKPKCFKRTRNGRHHLLEVEPETADNVVDDESPARVVRDTADLQLVTLDVRSLRHVQQTWRAFTPTSSVDLEWENDDVPDHIPTICQRRLMSTTEDCSTASALDGSPAESLEWDSCDNIQTALDTDTEQLLCEIERLTARALNETGGDWAYRSSGFM